ncbi:hypothetical protein M413DRAFT_239129 [Hebeloma cylindrosporum]|uniref:Uncharacterized protein n=1 Tax=Hebeloma cylindrosporum TaxID=76867 RepID=A0A0C3BQG7_HEBCY|nr:hypothetical protein M413DRAFT_239129 [Hebeloma cylindrosporum h7]
MLQRHSAKYFKALLVILILCWIQIYSRRLSRTHIGHPNSHFPFPESCFIQCCRTGFVRDGASGLRRIFSRPSSFLHKLTPNHGILAPSSRWNKFDTHSIPRLYSQPFITFQTQYRWPRIHGYPARTREYRDSS